MTYAMFVNRDDYALFSIQTQRRHVCFREWKESVAIFPEKMRPARIINGSYSCKRFPYTLYIPWAEHIFLIKSRLNFILLFSISFFITHTACVRLFHDLTFDRSLNFIPVALARSRRQYNKTLEISRKPFRLIQMNRCRK